jgi:hypothetical protein
MTTGASSKRSLLKFYVLVFALAVPFWLVGAVVEVEGLPMDLPVSALMLVCPITAAWILVRRDEGPGGMRRLMKRVFDYRKITRRIWYVPQSRAAGRRAANGLRTEASQASPLAGQGAAARGEGASRGAGTEPRAKRHEA